MARFITKCLSAFAVLCFIICLPVLSAADTDLGFLTFDKELYYGRTELSKMDGGKDLVKVYDMMAEAIENGEESFVVNTFISVHDIEITRDQLQVVASAYRFDNPQHFWWSRFKYHYYPDSDDTDGNELVADVMLEYLDFDIAAAKEEFHNACIKFIEDAGIKSGMSEYEISKLLYDAVTDHVEYDLNAPNAHNAYGALIGKKAVCEGYAELYQYLLYLNGIQCHIVTGNAGGPHAWNLVRIDGRYYQSDPTWGDQSIVSYMYLNTTSALLLRERTLDDNGYPIPECVSDDASYYTVECGRESCFDNEPVLDNVVEQIRKKGYAKLYYTGEDYYNFYAWFATYEAVIRVSLDYNGVFSSRTLGVEFMLTANDYVVSEEVVTGDINGDEAITVDDAVYLLYSSMFGTSEFPVNQACDFNGDGAVTSRDAVYLLYYIFFGEAEFPLHTAV